ncbi:DUF3090 family protein [Tepidiforma sp.]|uniref:DUF3090 family protein n=1 Tax=Tepidiforma sp. TaxID=2682230 RepID=UPI002ADE7FF5|nr:DUF3090 family protein [Tepidiforma sp.]
MSEPIDLGRLSYISAEAIGEPGRRRFRLRVINAGGFSASIWLEKQQLAALGDAIETVLTDEGYEYVPLRPDDAPGDALVPTEEDDLELQVMQLSMGVNAEERHIVLIAAGGPPGGDTTATMTMEFDYRRGFELRGEIAAVIAAGRPLCPLCTAPIDPSGHMCVRRNGHHRIDEV